MPEINPLSNDQIFLKKIAENTGSDYNTGDVSEINPLTIDQILLKEIAENTAGQSGDITELEEKVSANAEAIEAMVNVNGAKNWALLEPESESKDGITFTCTDGKSLTLSGTASDNTGKSYNLETPITGNVIVTLEQTANKVTLSYNDGTDWHPLPADGKVNGTITQIGFNIVSGTVINETVYLMIRDARITDNTYVPYAMTNRELTDEVNNIETLQTIYPSMLLTGSITIKRNCGVKFVVADNLILTADLASGDFIELCTAGTVLNPPVVTTEFVLHAASGGVNIAPVNLIMAADGSISVKNYSSSDTLLYAHCCGAYI